MKLTIKAKTKNGMSLPAIIDKGDWIDLRAAENCDLEAGEFKIIELGIAMQLPKGFEAIVVPRSSTFKKFGILLPNSVGVIDETYCGDDDTWKFPAFAPKAGHVQFNDRICQFRIQLSQKANVWQKLKWLFCNGVRIERVSSLGNKSRGGIGSTGVK